MLRARSRRTRAIRCFPHVRTSLAERHGPVRDREVGGAWKRSGRLAEANNAVDVEGRLAAAAAVAFAEEAANGTCFCNGAL